MPPAMRHSNRQARGRGPSALAAGLVALVTAIAVVACGSQAAPAASPTPAPTPVVTPDPHLSEPVTANQIYGILAAARLGMTCPTASLGEGQNGIVKQINCDVAGWPLRIVQYQSGVLLDRNLHWDASRPGSDEPPYLWAALNVAISYGPISARAPSAPDATRAAMAAHIVDILDPLLWPLRQHSVEQIPARTPVPAPAASPSAAPTKAPTKASSKPPTTPKPSKTP
jgi:hypothetical protein